MTRNQTSAIAAATASRAAIRRITNTLGFCLRLPGVMRTAGGVRVCVRLRLGVGMTLQPAREQMGRRARVFTGAGAVWAAVALRESRGEAFVVELDGHTIEPLLQHGGELASLSRLRGIAPGEAQRQADHDP